MKKPAIGFGEGGFKGFVARHVEKVVLVSVVVLMAMFIYMDSNTKPLGNENITQQSMTTAASTATSKIQEDNWKNVETERLPPSVVVSERAVDSSTYPLKISWDLPAVPRLTPRTDPRLMPAEHLIATPIFGPLLLLPPEDEKELPVDPLEKYEVTLGGLGGMPGMSGGNFMPSGPTSGDEKGETKSRREPRPKSPRPGSAPKSSMEAMAPPSSSSGGKKGKKDDNPYGEMPSSMSSSSMGATAAGAKTRTMPPEATLGVRGTAGMIVKPTFAMVINASVPYKAQWAAYEEAFSSSPGGQDPTRDIPEYLDVYVERADVTDAEDADPASLKWTQLPPKSLRALENQYGAESPEVSDPAALDPKITHPAPPIALTDLTPVITHPDIPKAAAITDGTDVMTDDEASGDEMDEIPGGGLDSEGGAGSMPGPGRMPGGNRASPGGMPGMKRMPPGGMPGMGRMPAGGGRMPPSSGGMMPGAGRMTPRGSSMGSGSMGAGGMGRMPPGGMAGGAMQGAGGDLSSYRVVAKKQVRFVDFDVEPGRKYRYRFQLAIQDPNHPYDTASAPDITSLDQKARERVKALDAADGKSKSKRRTYWIFTAWSEPSNVATLPLTDRYYAGESHPASTLKMVASNNAPPTIVATGEPEAKVAAVHWDTKLGVFAPSEISVRRGSPLSMHGDVEAIHPALGDLLKITDYTLQTNAIALDMTGGEYLPYTDRNNDPERAPGEVLVLDAAGNLIVSDEAMDVDQHRKFIFPEPKEPESSKTAGGTDPGGPATPGEFTMPSPPGYPGGPGAKGPKARSPSGTKRN